MPYEKVDQKTFLGELTRSLADATRSKDGEQEEVQDVSLFFADGRNADAQEVYNKLVKSETVYLPVWQEYDSLGGLFAMILPRTEKTKGEEFTEKLSQDTGLRIEVTTYAVQTANPETVEHDAQLLIYDLTDRILQKE